MRSVPGTGRWIVAHALFSLFFLTTTATARQPTSAYQDASAPITAEALRASIGRSVGQPGFNPAADLNGDGVVNALDAALFRLAEREGRGDSSLEREGLPGAEAINTRRQWGAPRTERGTEDTDRAGKIGVGGTERIIVEAPITTALPGQTVSVLFLLRDNAIPLAGYTVDVDIVADSGAVGIVTANVGLTNFFDIQNLITACPPVICPTGATRDSLFSVIADNGSGGVSITTITDGFSTVLAVDDVNDVLAQVFFDVSADALGDFTIGLGSSSTLIDANAAAVPFAFTPGMIRVLGPVAVPTVSEWGMIVMSVMLVAAGCVVFAGRGGAIGLAGGEAPPETCTANVPNRLGKYDL